MLVVPARIDRLASSQDIVSGEGTNISLICRAKGNPPPKITWTVHRLIDRTLKPQGTVFYYQL